MNAIPKPHWTEAAGILAEVLQAENAALAANDFTTAAALLPAKRAAIHAIDLVPPSGSKQGLTDLIGRLDRLIVENRRLLRRSIVIQSEVLGIIAGAARVAFVLGYGSSGKSASKTAAFAISAKA